MRALIQLTNSNGGRVLRSLAGIALLILGWREGMTPLGVAVTTFAASMLVLALLGRTVFEWVPGRPNYDRSL